jgi:hypothetical protein
MPPPSGLAAVVIPLDRLTGAFVVKEGRAGSRIVCDRSGREQKGL